MPGNSLELNLCKKVEKFPADQKTTLIIQSFRVVFLIRV